MAVAIKKLGYKNIKIYKEGIKGWKKKNLPLIRNLPLPSCKAEQIDVKTFKEILKRAEKENCQQKRAILIVDFRNIEPIIGPIGIDSFEIKTPCPTLKIRLDDIINEETRNLIPKDIPVFIFSETGNRDKFFIRYMCKFGYKNIRGIKGGAREMLKEGLLYEEN